MGRSPCCDKVGLRKGPWTAEEDQKLSAYIEQHGHGSWRALPEKAGLHRCGKSCRLRWINYLRPDIKRGKFSLQEEQTIIQLHALLGNRWSTIAAHLARRTDNEIKNYWNTHLKKRLTKMGIDPVTHKPKTTALGSSQAKDAANLSHMTQWESARLEAEARLGRNSKLVYNPDNPHLRLSASAQLLNKALVPPPPSRRLAVPPPLNVLKTWQERWLNSKPTKDIAIPGGFLTPAGSLESPISTLNSVENVFMNPSNGFAINSMTKVNSFVENSGSIEGGGMIKGDFPYPGKSNNFQELHEWIESSSVNFADMAYPTGDTDSLGLQSFMESFTYMLVDNDDGHNSSSNTVGQSDTEENKNYWNSVLTNLLNSPPAGSPVLF
ncbi:unnamed protein product [Ilex paraguariensis]|uniref:Uncharacterized protein n=1 Tax=Ilex paraguariensis TaxID=185542 RepID=A0ABC8R516_9AQUA